MLGALAATRLHASIAASEGTAGCAGAGTTAVGADAGGAFVTAAVRGNADGCGADFDVAIGVAGFESAACCELGVPVQFATTMPVTTAVTMTSAKPIAVSFQGFQLSSFIARSSAPMVEIYFPRPPP